VDKKARPTKVAGKLTAGRRHRFVASVPVSVNETEAVAKFMKGCKDLKNSNDPVSDFEILCINTIGYVPPIARKVLYNLAITNNEK
jgi:hypothetical protein